MVQNIKFRDVNTADKDALTAFFLERIKEDMSVVVWWLRPLVSVVNLQWLFQPNEPTPAIEDIKAKIPEYCAARMASIAVLVYTHQVYHDPANGPNFNRNKNTVSLFSQNLASSRVDITQVTKGLREIKNLPTVSQWHVDIRDWPSFSRIEKRRVRAVGEQLDESDIDPGVLAGLFDPVPAAEPQGPRPVFRPEPAPQ